MSEAQATANSLFKGLNDRFNGIMVSSDMEKCSREDFPVKLQGVRTY